MFFLKEGFVLIVLAISLALTPSLVAADNYTINIRTDKQTYHVGEKWAGVFWNPKGACMTMTWSPTGTLAIDGPSIHTSAKIMSTQLTTGSYTPSIGNPWVADDVGNWTLRLSITNMYDTCLASGTTAFQVSS
jgi:hypothetical protein